MFLSLQQGKCREFQWRKLQRTTLEFIISFHNPIKSNPFCICSVRTWRVYKISEYQIRKGTICTSNRGPRDILVLLPWSRAFSHNFIALWSSLRCPHLGSLGKPGRMPLHFYNSYQFKFLLNNERACNDRLNYHIRQLVHHNRNLL